MIEIDHVLDAVEARREYAVDVLRRLLRASQDGEDATQRMVVVLLREFGWQLESLNRRPSVISTRGEFADPSEIDDRPRRTIVASATEVRRPSSNSRLLLWAHPDGMPFDGAPGWRFDPFEGVIEDGRIHGWGVADDLSGVAAMIAVAAVLNDLGNELADVVVASTPSKGHASGVLAALGVVKGVRAGIYLHPAESGRGLEDIKALAPGMLRLRLTVQGRQPDTREPNHALYVEEAIDPVPPMIRILDALQGFNEARKQTIASGSPVTMMVGTLSAGDSISRSPADCRAVVTFSLPPGESLEETRESIARTIDQVCREDDWLSHHPPQVDWLYGTTGVQIPEDHPLYSTVAGAVETVTGVRPRYYGGHIASEIRQPILNHDIPCVGIGPRSGSLTQAGSATDEWLDLDDFQRMISVCALAALNWSRSAG